MFKNTIFPGMTFKKLWVCVHIYYSHSGAQFHAEDWGLQFLLPAAFL